MSVGLARRLRKLEASITDPSGERQARIAAGLCPDCGYKHLPLPTNGGPWRCVVCGHRFVLKPGPACIQMDNLDADNRGCYARQIGCRREDRDEHHRAWFDERHAQDAFDDLRESMAPDHRLYVATWTREHLVDDEPIARPGEGWYALLERCRPPALVRAVWILVQHHVETNATVMLPPDVAEVYLRDPDAWPVAPCSGCGYLMPGRAEIRPDDTYDFPGGVYIGACPVCGLDNHREEEGTS